MGIDLSYGYSKNMHF